MCPETPLKPLGSGSCYSTQTLFLAGCVMSLLVVLPEAEPQDLAADV